MFARTELAVVRLRLATADLKHVTGGGLLVAANYRLSATSGRGLLTRVDGGCVDVDASGRWAWGIPGSRDADLSTSSCNLDTSESIGCTPTEGVGMSDSTPDREPNDQELLSNGMDDSTGDPNNNRSYLMDTPPAQVDDEAVREHSAEGTDERNAGD